MEEEMYDAESHRGAKVTWGIVAGICFMVWSFVTVALVAIYVISGMMIAEVGSDDGLRESIWTMLLYGGEAVTILGFIVSIILYIKRK